MYLVVDMGSNGIEEFLLRHFRVESIQILIDTWGCMIMHMSLVTEDTSLHAYEIIHRSLLPSFHVTLLLILLSLEEVARIILIADRQRYEMQLLQAVDDTTFSTHRHHLEDTLLRTVIAILGSTLSLGNPDILVLLLNGEVHIVGKALARHQHLAHTQSTLHDKCLVDTHQVLDPRKRQEIISDGYLAGGRELVVYKHHIEDG